VKRREFIVGFGALVVVSAHLASAQQSDRPLIGILSLGTSTYDLEHYREGLKEAGYVEGQNLAIEYRFANDDPSRLSELASDLVRSRVRVIVAGGTNSVLAAKAATMTIPIVFLTGGDPVNLGLVSSLNRPEANVTGISFMVEDLGGKDLGLLHELIPDAKSIGFLINPDNPNALRQIRDLQDAARKLGLELEPLRTTNERQLQEAFGAKAGHLNDAVLVGADPYFGSQVDQIERLAAQNRVPTVYYRRQFTDAGGLMSYGTSDSDAWRQVAIYTARILRGAKPGDLPVIQSTKFELVINLKTAKTLGLTIPPSVLARADEVIE